MNKITTSAENFLTSITGWNADLSAEKLWKLAQFLLTLALIYIFFKVLSIFVKKFVMHKCSLQTQHIINKVIHYSAFTIIVLTIFHRLGINISAILGAAGIAGIAIGFAAQTSISNVISGLFVITERAFKIGDIIEIAGTIGTVQAINLLSVVLKTFDSQYVRVPNETIIKANLINYSHFPFRRVKTELSVPYGTDLRKLEKILLDTAKKNQFCVEDPAPSILWTAFAAAGINFTLLTWTTIEDFGNLRNSIFIDVAERLNKEGIEIPFPQTDIHIKDYPEDFYGIKPAAKKAKKNT
ncbi:mechanosensitive ion channel [Treponema sp. OMZ 840]|uniref:mechanosensitive ion channel family protein n=1 Tax=Treponema sp. OMZ 840 TaxID=244313 RepID=UPI003D8BEA6D